LSRYLKKAKRLFRIIASAYKTWQTENKLLIRFYHDLNIYKSRNIGIKKPKIILYPCLYDATENTVIDKLYFLQDNWAFDRVVRVAPRNHVDVGSHHIFVSLLSKILPVIMVDIRPLSIMVDSLKFVEGTILNLPFEDESVTSLSSLCVIEHIGLGRYGDPIDPDGSVKAIAEIDRVLRSGAHFYLSVPVERENKIYFNAHRSFSESFLFNLLNNYEVLNKMYIYDKEYDQMQPEKFGVGCYHLVKN
jgi:SAM-dependent methyltransferase